MSILSDCIGQDDCAVTLTASDFQNSGSGSDVPEGDKSQSVFLLCVETWGAFAGIFSSLEGIECHRHRLGKLIFCHENEIDLFISALLPALNELL